MTPRKELFLTIREALKDIAELELVDLYREQFETGKAHEWTAGLIRINGIQWETMTENLQEGNTTVDVLFYCKDGWLDQHHLTGDPEGGLIEIDVIDTIVETLQFLKGDHFKPLQQTEDEPEELDVKGVMAYRISFKTMLYRRINGRYTNVKLTN